MAYDGPSTLAEGSRSSTAPLRMAAREAAWASDANRSASALRFAAPSTDHMPSALNPRVMSHKYLFQKP